MKILHYTIGFSPERSGGLPRYATDLMEEQAKQGHEVYALYPGRINIMMKSPYIKKVKRTNVSNVNVFELINSLPLPLFGGIKSPNDFMMKSDSKVYEDFLDIIDVDIIHVHTLMGLHSEFFKMSKQKKIKMIFTSHDYFGLSSVPDFYLDGKSWDEENSNEFWNKCAINAMSTNKLRVFQLSVYPIIRKIMVKFKGSRENRNTTESSNKSDTIDFSDLKKYYEDIFKLFDAFHFNSNIAKEVYFKNLSFLNDKIYEVISITNASIHNNSKIEISPVSIKRIAYIGPYQENKGFYDFLDFAKQHKDEGYIFLAFGGDKSFVLPSYIENRGKFLHSEIEQVLSSIDLLVIPSRWKETFGFLVLEALSYGTTVMVSTNVGASMLIDNSQIFVKLRELSIPKSTWTYPFSIKTMSEHVDEISKLYEREKKND